jgi:hypothetical protein
MKRGAIRLEHIFLIQEGYSEEHADDAMWRQVVLDRYQHLQDPVWLLCNAAPDIKYDSSTTKYFKHFFTQLICPHIISGGIKFVLPPVLHLTNN